MESKELKELKVQIALGLIIERDLQWAIQYPNRAAPGEECWKQVKPGSFRFKSVPRNYVIDPRCPNDVLHFIIEKVYGFKRT